MSDEKKVNVLIDKDILLEAVLRAVYASMESEGRMPVIVPLGQVGGISLELGAYDTDRMELSDDDEVMEIVLENPAVYQQLDLKFMH